MQAVAAEIETITNPRLAAKARITGGDISADLNSPRLQNWNHVLFAYPMPEGNVRFRLLIRSLSLPPTNGALLPGRSFDARNFYPAPTSRPAAST